VITWGFFARAFTPQVFLVSSSSRRGMVHHVQQQASLHSGVDSLRNCSKYLILQFADALSVSARGGCFSENFYAEELELGFVFLREERMSGEFVAAFGEIFDERDFLRRGVPSLICVMSCSQIFSSI